MLLLTTSPQWFQIMILPAALALDLIIGDPLFLPHPVRWMGSAIQRFEPYFRQLPLKTCAAGGLMAVSLITGTWLTGWLLLTMAFMISPFLGWSLAVIMLFYALSIRSLASAACSVQKALSDGDITLARQRLRYIVGREVDRLDQQGIARAAVETVAENLVDGVISPLFYALIGGPAMAMAYKMINTLDSMIGYKNEKYREFGRWAAKIDDAANYLPARLATPVIALAAQILAKRGKTALRTAVEEGRRHHSPNAGFPEAGFAGALKVWLGGPNFYHGILVEKPYIGKGLGNCSTTQISQACDLMFLSAILWALTCWLIEAGLLFFV